MKISLALAVTCFAAMIIIGTVQLPSDNSAPTVAETAADKAKAEEQRKKEEQQKKEEQRKNDAVLYKAFEKKIVDFTKEAFKSSALFVIFETEFLNNPQPTVEGYEYVQSYKEQIISYRDFLDNQQVPKDLSEDVRELLNASKENMIYGTRAQVRALDSLLEYYDELEISDLVEYKKNRLFLAGLNAGLEKLEQAKKLVEQPK
ncbi:hypothetical protein [Paenibacillus plantiphilus]|nr:hypothetical protein [Paenibacillus plantiphilus]